MSLLFLKYPAGNRRLFHLLTGYAVFVGAAMVALLYVPDIPFFLLGLASLAVIAAARRQDRNAHRPAGRDDAHDDTSDRRGPGGCLRFGVDTSVDDHAFHRVIGDPGLSCGCSTKERLISSCPQLTAHRAQPLRTIGPGAPATAAGT